MAELQRAEALPLFLFQHFEFNGQAVAVPARDVVHLAAPQHLKPVPNVFQDLGQVGGKVGAGA